MIASIASVWTFRNFYLATYLGTDFTRQPGNREYQRDAVRLPYRVFFFFPAFYLYYVLGLRLNHYRCNNTPSG